MDLPILALLFVGVFLTFSRGGYSLYLLTVSSVLLRIRTSTRRRSWYELAKIFCVFGVLVAGAWLFIDNVVLQMELSEDALSRLVSLYDRSITDNYVENRGLLVEDRWRLFMESPLAGAGVRTSMEMEEGPHNMFVRIALDSGALGLVAYVLLIVSTFWRAMRRFNRNKSNETIFIMLGMGWLALSGFHSHTIIYDMYNVLALSLAISASAARARRPAVEVPAFRHDYVLRHKW